MSNNNKVINQLTAKTKSLEAELQQARMAIKNYGAKPKAWQLDLDAATAPKEEEETWFATYLDMMTLLLVLMIVMLSFAGQGSGSSSSGSGSAAAGVGLQSESQYALEGLGTEQGGYLAGEGQGVLDGGMGLDHIGTDSELDSERRLSEMGFSELGDDIDVVLNDQSVSFRINSEILFPSGQADLSLAGISVLKKLVDVLKNNDYALAVEGHTDSIPMRGSRYPSNWELSGSRAGSVVRYFEANGIDSSRLRAVGFADTRPLESNDTADGRAQNRRVELTMEIPTAN